MPTQKQSEPRTHRTVPRQPDQQKTARRKPANRPRLTGPACRSCRGATDSRSSTGLCRGCFTQPSARTQFGVARYNAPGLAVQPQAMPLPACPTDAEPGSAEKVAVMRERLARGEHLHHPDDRRLPEIHEFYDPEPVPDDFDDD